MIQPDTSTLGKPLQKTQWKRKRTRRKIVKDVALQSTQSSDLDEYDFNDIEDAELWLGSTFGLLGH